MSTYYIKAYFVKQDQQQQPEIRRFAIDISPENDAYKELQTKIATFQANVQSKDIVLQYNDEENERITFSSNDELRSAIDSNKESNTLKIFVTFIQAGPETPQAPQTSQTSPSETAEKECHVGVLCDGCNGPVIGFRYKCFVCPNYDLCEKCSAAGIHSEHNTIKITKPGNAHFPHSLHRHHPHAQFHHHARHHRHTPPRRPFPPATDLVQQIQAQIPQWLPNRENTAAIRTHIQQHLEALKTNTQSHVQNSKQYLESVGQYLQQTLSPFGIDCEYHVDEKNSASSSSTTTTTTTTSTDGPHTTVEHHEEVTTTTTDETDPTPEPSAVPKNSNVEENVDESKEEQKLIASTDSSIEESTKITNPLERAVEDCMERMKAMGFVDANGALIELVRSKQGDINAVLDAINPRHQ